MGNGDGDGVLWCGVVSMLVLMLMASNLEVDEPICIWPEKGHDNGLSYHIVSYYIISYRQERSSKAQSMEQFMNEVDSIWNDIHLGCRDARLLDGMLWDAIIF